MKNSLLVIILLISVTLHGQYYYNDIIATQEITNKMKTYMAAKVQSVTATGLDPQGRKTTDFDEWQDIQANGSVLKVTSRHGQDVNRVYYSFDNKTRLINTRDSSGDIENITVYTYDMPGNLVNIKMTVKDSKQDFNETEERKWQYTSSGRPEKMWRIINGKDSTGYSFNPDEHGNVTDETLFRKLIGKDTVYYYYEDQRIYYYYDDKDRLTDIVRYNRKAKQFFPDVMFEYDDQNRVIQRITPISINNPAYLTWRYAFNEKGLKTKEALYQKSKDPDHNTNELRGRIDYIYSFAP